MRKVVWWLYASGGDGWGVFSREARIPDKPFPGLLVCFDDEEDGDCWEVCRVAWMVHARQYVCYLGDHPEPFSTWEQVKAFYRGLGWMLDEETLGSPDE